MTSPGPEGDSSSTAWTVLARRIEAETVHARRWS